MSKGFNENTRVQVPAILHLTRLGYTYIGKIYEENAGEQYDSETNILIDEFHNSFNRLNPGKEKEWQHIINLRYHGTTGAPHPQMHEVMKMAYPILVSESNGRIK